MTSKYGGIEGCENHTGSLTIIPVGLMTMSVPIWQRMPVNKLERLFQNVSYDKKKQQYTLHDPKQYEADIYMRVYVLCMNFLYEWW